MSAFFFARFYGCRWRYSALSPSSQTETFKEMFANSKANEQKSPSTHFCSARKHVKRQRLKKGREELKSEEIIGSFGQGGRSKPKPWDTTTQEFVRRRNVSYFQMTACSFTPHALSPQSCQDFWTGSDAETASAAWTGGREGTPSPPWLQEFWYASHIDRSINQPVAD